MIRFTKSEPDCRPLGHFVTANALFETLRQATQAFRGDAGLAELDSLAAQIIDQREAERLTWGRVSSEAPVDSRGWRKLHQRALKAFNADPTEANAAALRELGTDSDEGGRRLRSRRQLFKKQIRKLQSEQADGIARFLKEARATLGAESKARVKALEVAAYPFAGDESVTRPAWINETTSILEAVDGNPERFVGWVTGAMPPSIVSACEDAED